MKGLLTNSPVRCPAVGWRPSSILLPHTPRPGGCSCCWLLRLLLQVVPCAVLATFAHPFTSHLLVFRVGGGSSTWQQQQQQVQPAGATARDQCGALQRSRRQPLAACSMASCVVPSTWRQARWAVFSQVRVPACLSLCLPACLSQILWAVCVYMEAVSVLPQLRMMQNSKVVERFTAHYVFCLGLSRFFSCAHWILQVGLWGGW